ncbi:MAG: hypothetical protein BWY25_03120 [Chloroflexi bacterium ADurb.Bin222]|nr:MAG: hypothetical protein BWY25_03120 [Chloroflexi bacterium ADurb.Bin222]
MRRQDPDAAQLADPVEGVVPAVGEGGNRPIRGDGDDIEVTLVGGQLHKGNVLVIGDVAIGPRQPDLAMGCRARGSFLCAGEGANLVARRRDRFGKGTGEGAQHVDLSELAAVAEAVLPEEDPAPAVILPGEGNQVAAPAFGLALPERGEGGFSPGERFLLDAGPLDFRRDLDVEEGVLAEEGVGDQCARCRVPEADVRLWVEVAEEHEDAEGGFADMAVAPIAAARARFHEQALQLLQVLVSLVVPGTVLHGFAPFRTIHYGVATPTAEPGGRRKASSETGETGR